MKKYILIDFSSLAHRIFFSLRKVEENENIPLTKRIFYKAIFERLIGVYRNSIYNNFPHEFVFCFDGGNSWRKDYFPHYKHGRKFYKSEEDRLQFEKCKSFINSFYEDFSPRMPFPFYKVNRCEGDDILAFFCFYKNKLQEKCYIDIYSEDKDMGQLCRLENVKMFNFSLKRRYVDDIEEELLTHICRGDLSDSIPNIFSTDNHFTKHRDNILETTRQARITQKFLEDNIFNGKYEQYFLTEEGRIVKKNFERNKLLIDLRMIPKEIKKSILEEFRNLTICEDNDIIKKIIIKNELIRDLNFLDVFQRKG